MPEHKKHASTLVRRPPKPKKEPLPPSEVLVGIVYLSGFLGLVIAIVGGR